MDDTDQGVEDKQSREMKETKQTTIKRRIWQQKQANVCVCVTHNYKEYVKKNKLVRHFLIYFT